MSFSLKNIFSKRKKYSSKSTDYGKSIFVGRSLVIGKTLSFFKTNLLSKSQVNLPIVVFYGKGGFGKSHLCQHMVKALAEINVKGLGVIDLNEPNNRSILSIIKFIATNLPGDFFKEVIVTLDKYDDAKDLDKLLFFENALSLFYSALEKSTYDLPTIIIIDTIQVVQHTKFYDKFLSFIGNCKGKCGFILAGHEDIWFNNPAIIKTSYQIIGFDPDDLKNYTILRLQNSGISKGIISDTFIFKIHYLTNGHPILCALTIDWIIENPSQLEYITNLPKETFEHELILLLNNLNNSEIKILKLMPYINKRISPDLINSITDIGLTDSINIVNNLSRFSFIKYFSYNQSIVLHDEIQRLISIAFPLSDEAIRGLYLKVLKYYALILTNESKIPQIVDTKVENLYYLFKYNTIEALSKFEIEFHLALDIFDFDFCDLLIDEASRNISLPSVSKITSLFKAELLVSQYKPVEANTIIDKLLPAIDKNNEEMLYAEALECIGNCIINPCTMINADRFKAIEYFQKSYLIYSKYSNINRVPYCLFSLGKAYVSIGRHLEANTSFTNAVEIAIQSKNYRLSAKILDEKGKMLRLQQNVEESLNHLQQSFELRSSFNLTQNIGIYNYYLANTYRDLNDFIKAEEYYLIAEKMLLKMDDKFSLCELYCDMSWFEYLRNDDSFEIAEKFLEKAWEIAKFYGFGTEYSEYYHIKYEISILRGDYDNAYKFLDEALSYAYKYSNIYMILDCLNHDAQRAFRLDQFNRMSKILDEMKNYEDMGCGIKVFRGRTLLTLGDFYFKQKDFKSTFNNWLEGFCIVALYGNSRSNVELFNDLFNSRLEQFTFILNFLGAEYKDIFINYWNKYNVPKVFDYVLEICK